MSEEDDIAGVDGCRGGWIVATTNGASVVTSLTAIEQALIGIDMPIGLGDEAPRACDQLARRYLGRGGSSVFPAPPRACLGALDYPSALGIARTVSGRGISKQTYNLIAKIKTLDGHIDPGKPIRFVEVHPECSFKVLNRGGDLPSKRTATGQMVRRRLLSTWFDVPNTAPRGAAIDDLLDAYAVLWSTRRFQRGEHIVFGDGRRDVRNIEMRIIC